MHRQPHSHALWAVALALLCSPTVHAASIHVEDQTSCLDKTGVAEKIEEILAVHEGGERGSITVAGAPAEHGTLASLRVVTVVGEIVLERRFDLKPEDCASATDLIATVLERFLQGFPKENWGEDPPARRPIPIPEKVVVTQDVSQFSGFVFFGADTRWLPTSGDIEIGVAADVGSERHCLTGSTVIRIGFPHELGGGRYIESLGMLGVGWRYGSTSWLSRLEVRTGGLLVSGFGYDTNYHTWLLWLEFHGAMMWQVGPVLLGPQVGISPLRHRVMTADGDKSRIPWLRVGVVVALPFWSKKM